MRRKIMNMKTDAELISYFSKTRKLHKNTETSYRIYIKQYAEYNHMSMVDLIQEAEDEEEAGIRWKHRTLKKLLNKRCRRNVKEKKLKKP